jgi:hypothetical protein
MNEGLPPLREFLLREVLRFVRTASSIPGVTRIALVGSLATTKPNPKDADVLVSVTDDVDLARLATAGRTLKGRAQTRNSGADIFLADSRGYIGRICHWRECWPRRACRAQHCARKEHLNDDLHVVNLNIDLVRAPPIELWPNLASRVAAPADVQELLLTPLTGLQESGASEEA